MTPDDRPRFAETLSDVFGYYGRECTPFLVNLFWDGLRRFDLGDVLRAFSVHAQDPDRGQFAPRIADITRLLEGSTQTQGMRAWSRVERALRSVGAYQSVVFDDPLVHAVVRDMGGWVRLCQTPLDELPFRAREFERSYAAYRMRRETPAYPPRLIGIAETENATSGFALPAPVLIGDPERAELVAQRGSEDAASRITHSARPARALIAR
jgi:hypothetical protein